MNCSLFSSGAHLKGVVNNAVTESAFDEFVCMLSNATPWDSVSSACGVCSRGQTTPKDAFNKGVG